MTESAERKHAIATLDWLQSYLDTHPTSIAAVARQIPGVTASTLSKVLSLRKGGEYLERYLPFLTDNVIAAIDGFHAAVDNCQDGEVVFVETSVARRVFKRAQIAREKRVIGLVEAPSGCGKTTAVRELVRQNPQFTVYVTGRPNSTPIMLLRDLCMAVKTTVPQGRDRLQDNLCEALSPLKLVIIDQLHDLRPDCIGELMYLHDRTHCPMLLVGTRRAHDLLYGYTRQFEQFCRRIKTSVWITNERDGRRMEIFSREDIAALAAASADALPDSALAWMYARANEDGNLDVAMHTLEDALDALHDTPDKITSQVLDACLARATV